MSQALEAGVISQHDLLATDAHVLELLSRSFLAADIERLRRTNQIVEGAGPNARHVMSKARLVDPPVLTPQGVVPISDLVPSVKDAWNMVRAVSETGILVSPA